MRLEPIGDGANVLAVGGVLEPAPGNSNDVASSQGVRLTDFVGVTPGSHVDEGVPQDDPVFRAGGVTVRRVEPRNTPTTINAVLNFFNFWDGRANPFFNGVNPFGLQDTGARVFAAQGGTLVVQYQRDGVWNALRPAPYPALVSQVVWRVLLGRECGDGVEPFVHRGPIRCDAQFVEDVVRK